MAQLSFVAALAVLDLVDGPLPGRARCKWPNDVLVDGGKVAGVLLESALGPGGRVDWVVLGIGVNLANHPGIEGPIPSTSLVDAGAPPLAPEEALPSVLAALERRRREWETQGFAATRSAWLDRAHGLAEPVTVDERRAETYGRVRRARRGGRAGARAAGLGPARHLGR